MNSSETIHQDPSILLVDDEPVNFEIMYGILQSCGYHLRYASNGLNALAQVSRRQPDLLLMDVMMPDLDGIELCRRIKSNPDWQAIPIIMVTALDSKDDLARCIEAGADDFLSKPVSAIELRARIRSMLRIKQQQDALKASLQIRSDMANMIVHDLRNPLTNIVLACDMLDRANLPDKFQKRVDRIKIAELQLRSLTESLLLMAKLESGKIILNRENIALSYLIKESISDIQAIADQKKIQITYEFQEAETLIWADALLLRRVLDNLLSNAIKYSPSNSQITVESCYLENNNVQIQVMDTGPGINDELKELVFEKYEVGALIENIPQIGLGLAFCQMAVHAHGGSISVKDNQPRGTIVVVKLTTLST